MFRHLCSMSPPSISPFLQAAGEGGLRGSQSINKHMFMGCCIGCAQDPTPPLSAKAETGMNGTTGQKAGWRRGHPLVPPRTWPSARGEPGPGQHSRPVQGPESAAPTSRQGLSAGA